MLALQHIHVMGIARMIILLVSTISIGLRLTGISDCTEWTVSACVINCNVYSSWSMF